jgi:hypothetical protein
MRATQSIWTESKGWHGDSDAGANLVLAFGSSAAMRAGDRWRELGVRYPGAILLGCSTGGEIHGCEVLDESLCATAISFARTRLRAATAGVANDSFAAGRQLGLELAGPDLKAVFLLSDGTRTNGSELVRGLRGVVGADVVLSGGLAGDGADFGTTYVGLGGPIAPGQMTPGQMAPGQMAPGQMAPGLAAAVGFYGDALTLGHGSCGGWDVFGPERRITKSKANVLYELDGKPALDLYKRYLGEDAQHLPGSALLFPLRIYPPEKPEQSLVRTVVGIDEAARTMTFAGDMPEGFSCQLMRGNFDRLIGGAATAAEQAQTAGTGARVAVLVSCIGRKLLLGQRICEEVEAVRDVLGAGTQLAGFYSYGEVSPHAVTGAAELHNQTMTITTFSEAV